MITSITFTPTLLLKEKNSNPVFKGREIRFYKSITMQFYSNNRIQRPRFTRYYTIDSNNIVTITNIGNSNYVLVGKVTGIRNLKFRPFQPDYCRAGCYVEVK